MTAVKHPYTSRLPSIPPASTVQPSSEHCWRAPLRAAQAPEELDFKASALI